ncbi:MAG: M14 family metallopeptidase, partial [Glaciimonas sp.]|nr:M14 family metallopeptidase [Glaciimonas sp.]
MTIFPKFPSRKLTFLASTFALTFGVVLYTPAVLAQYDAAKTYVEVAAVAKQYPDPNVTIDSPAFATGKTDFTSQEEMQTFIQKLAAQSPIMRVQQLGTSQQGRAIPLLIFSSQPVADGAQLSKNGKPTVLIIGSQHGNEPAGGEAALAFAGMLVNGKMGDILDRVNILIVPRANHDGTAAFKRGLTDGQDVNRDHLTLATPEGQALAKLFNAYQPEVVLDCHEFSAAGRWIDKFGAVQKYDGLIQFATVANLQPEQVTASETLFRQSMLKAFDKNQLSHSWYFTTNYDKEDKSVAMGGVGPDTGRNIAGLRNAISFLLETRGVGIGKAHFKRRVYTHLTAIESVVETTANHAEQVLMLNRKLRKDVAEKAGKGELDVIGVATP